MQMDEISIETYTGIMQESFDAAIAHIIRCAAKLEAEGLLTTSNLMWMSECSEDISTHDKFLSAIDKMIEEKEEIHNG